MNQMTRVSKKGMMETDSLWFKAPGVVVLDQCSINKEMFGRPADYMYDHIVINFPKRWVHMYPTKSVHDVLFFQSTNNLPCSNLIVQEFVVHQLSLKSSTDVIEMLELLVGTFGRCTTQMVNFATYLVHDHQNTITSRIDRYIPATVIQRTLKKCISDPSYKVCERRLRREFEGLEADVSVAQ